MMEDAFYHEQELIEFIGNPLIEALPPMVDPDVYPKLLMVLPDYSEEDRNKKTVFRVAQLQRLSKIHVPTKQDSMLFLEINRCLRWSYVGRNPVPFNEVKKFIEKKGEKLSAAQEKYLQTPAGPIYGFPVLGISGVGKTTSVENVLSLFPQVICHTNYRSIEFKKEQLVWVKVDCPPDGTPRGLCSAILRGVDKAMNGNFTEQILRNRMSKDVLLIKVSQLIQSLFLGVLVIDDIQNLCGAKENVSNELLNFMVSLANSLSIPVIMVGSPKILKLLQREFQQAKRASGEGEIRMNLMARESFEWERFITTIWRYQYTAKQVKLDQKMKNVFFDESVGNPFIAATLYKAVQDEAIINKSEMFSVSDVKRIAKEKMGITSKMRKDMLAGVDLELNAYNHLWELPQDIENSNMSNDKSGVSTFPAEDYNLIVQELSQKLISKGIPMNESRAYARQAVAAYPAEKNMDILFGYAIALAKAASDDFKADQS